MASESSSAKPNYRLLTEDQIQKIHHATLHVLEKVGVKVDHEEARNLAKAAGCTIKDNSIVLIPPALVEESLKSAPSSIHIYNQLGELAMELEGRNNYYGLGTDLKFTFDVFTGETRESVLQDVKNAAIVADACENIDFCASFALPSDVDTNVMYLACAKAEMENTSKPIFFTAGGQEDLDLIMQMAQKVAGGSDEFAKKPFLVHYSEPTAPLMHSLGAVRKLFYCAEHNIPICYVPGVLMGASGPVTLAGGIVQANAESLSGIVLSQLKKKGAPIISGWAVVPLDMKSMTYCYGAPDFRLTNTAFADIYHYYNIPCWSIVGSDSHMMDQQAGMEHGAAVLMAALDGANLIHDIAYLGQGLLGNPASIVMGNELISYIKRIMRGFEINEDTLALDIIEKIGPGGDFLSERHTLKHFRKELWRPKLMNRDPPEAWKKKGGKSYGEKAIEEAKKILEKHIPSPLTEEQQTTLDEIYEKAKKDLKNIQFPA